MKDVLVCSFYTEDEYYADKAKTLSDSLDRLGVASVIKPIKIPEGKNWPDICRLKINYIRDIYLNNSDRKVFWVDVDCELQKIPDFIINSSADIIGFQRGFQTPLRIGYHYKSRFWEPCFLGFNQTEPTRKFLYDASKFEKEFSGSATDDYFFEESWRLNASQLSFQVIPSGYAYLEGRKKSSTITPFFYFGASGNVKNYVDKVVQHSVPWISGSKRTPIKAVIKARLKKIVPRSLIERLKSVKAKKQSMDIKLFRRVAFEYGKQGDGVKLEALINRSGGHQYLSEDHIDVIKLAYSFLYFRRANGEESISTPISLAWWHLPEPGNFGDWLSPYIINKLTGRSVVFARPEAKNIAESHIFSVGSIGKFIKKNSIVLGTGISTIDAELNPDADYRMVRGPYTRAGVIKAGGSCPEVYGDPAIILPLIYTAQSQEGAGKSDKLLLIRHFKHAEIELKLPGNMFEKSIYVSHPSDIEEFIDELHSCSGVVTSAMHTYITCQAYGIPCALVAFDGYTDAVHGDGIKYKDYLLGVGLEEAGPVVVPCDLSNYDFGKILKTVCLDAEVKQRVYDVMMDTLSECA